jgi:hypothetical protein
MRTVIALVFLAVAVSSSVYLLVAFVTVLRNRTVRAWRSAAILVFMIFATWQAYLLNPVVAVPALYFLVPAIIAGALVILMSGVRDANSDEPCSGPERKIPAMAMRVSGSRAEDEDEFIAVAGGGRVA